MKIAFFGTGDFSKNILESILKNKTVEVALVVSQPDKPIGRKKIITSTPVKLLAQEYNIPVLQPNKLRNNIDFFDELIKGDYDFIVVVAYGKIVPIEVLEAPKIACVNIHGSILPAYRGASPIQEAVKNGDSKTGLTIMYMSEGMDEGDILKIEEVNINRDDTTQSIFEKFENIGAELLINTLEGVLKGKIIGKKQENYKATYCSKIEKQDGQIIFKDSAKQTYNKHKAYKSWPGIFTQYKGKKLSIEECDYSDENILEYGRYEVGDVVKYNFNGNNSIGILLSSGILIIKQIKLEGKKSMDINSFINGYKEFLDYNFII